MIENTRLHGREEVEAECARNKALGERLGCWKGGVLVEDDAGSVRRALQELEQQQWPPRFDS